MRIDQRRELALLHLDDPDAAAFLASLPQAERYSSWRLAQPDGSVAGYGSGIVDLLAAMRATRPAARLLAFVPARALDAVYGLVARHRSVLGRVLRDGPAPRRFP